MQYPNGSLFKKYETISSALRITARYCDKLFWLTGTGA